MINVFKYSTVIAVSILLLSGCGKQTHLLQGKNSIQRMDLSSYPMSSPNEPLNLLFIHHSCGAALFAETGSKQGKYCLYESHPNGGGLRNMLKRNNYNVHEATYGSKLGQQTDINNWHMKFRDNMNLVLKTKLQDDLLEIGKVNQIIVFKSCYPSNQFIGEGVFPGNPDSPEKTVWNAKAAYNRLLPIFQKYPDTIFVAVTAPPLVKKVLNKYKEILLNFIGKGPKQTGDRARKFNNWLVDIENGWLSEYQFRNVLVFDYYNILTGFARSNWTQYATRNGQNSHPSSAGNKIVAREFMKFINQGVIYSGVHQ